MRFGQSVQVAPPPERSGIVAVPPQLVTKALLGEAQEAVLELMRRPGSQLAFDSLSGSSSATDRTAMEMQTAIGKVVAVRHPDLDPQIRLRLIEALVHEMRGYGPLEPLLQNRDQYEEIEVNGPDRVYVVPKGGHAELTEIRFRDDEHVRYVAARLLATANRRVTDAQPLVDASLPNGIRMNVIAYPVAVTGTSMTLRLHHAYHDAQSLVANGTLTEEAITLLGALVRGGVNILVVGGTGSGKTTLCNLLANSIPAEERIVTVEDAVELQVRDGNVVRLETRLANIEGRGEITIRDLVRNALRMRPDRIIVGEMRGPEALDVLTAANSGHSVFSTVHANDAYAGLYKVLTYAAMTDEHLSEYALSKQVVEAFPCVVYLERQGQQRRVLQITEVTGADPATGYQTADIFHHSKGALRLTGHRPERWQRILAQRSQQLPDLWGW